MKDSKNKKALEFAGQHNIETVDLKLYDLFGRWHHLTIPVSHFDESIFSRE